MTDIYTRMQSTSDRLFGKYKQGTVKLITDGADTGPSWDPQPGAPTKATIQATVRGVEQKYIKEGYISASDLQVQCGPFDVDGNAISISNEKRIEVDGKERQIIEAQKIPAAGVTVAWRVMVKG